MSRTWPEWVDRHASVFALTHPRDLTMLGRWVVIFDLAGWTPDELDRATDWLALNADAFKSRSQHLAAIKDFVKGERQKALRAQERRESFERPCPNCGGSGRVVVPHLRSVQVPGFPWYTCAVGCDCPLGAWFVMHGGYLSLTDYQTLVPDWPELMKRRAAILALEHSEQCESALMDATLGAIRARQQKSQ
jgi:hypothetical protein